MNIAVHKRTHEELTEQLNHQILALRASCAGYDAGNFWEGPRLATTVYTVVNDGNNRSKSVLTQLGLRRKMQFLSYATPQMPGNLISWAPLCMMQMTAENCLHVPILDQGPSTKLAKQLSFADWWNEPIFENRLGKKLSRMNLTFSLRSKDGGSHFDAELPSSPYLEMKNEGLGFVFHDGSENPPKPIQNAHLATMRQIAFELERTILPYL